MNQCERFTTATDVFGHKSVPTGAFQFGRVEADGVGVANVCELKINYLFMLQLASTKSGLDLIGCPLKNH